MKIMVFGATGQTGTQVISQLLEKGHFVTAYVRNSGRVETRNTNLNIVEGSMEDAAALSSAMKGQEVVISCLGSATLKKSTVLETFAKQIKTAMTSCGVKKIVYMASAGIHNEVKGIPGFIVKLILGRVLKDHANAASQFMNDDFVYTIARPVQLSDGPLTGKYLTATSGVPGGKAISRADVAHFLIEAAVSDKFKNQSVGLSG